MISERLLFSEARGREALNYFFFECSSLSLDMNDATDYDEIREGGSCRLRRRLTLAIGKQVRLFLWVHVRDSPGIWFAMKGKQMQFNVPLSLRETFRKFT